MKNQAVIAAYATRHDRPDLPFWPLLFANVTKLRFELGRGPDCSLPHYLNNFLRAVRYAAERGGGVSIA